MVLTCNYTMSCLIIEFWNQDLINYLIMTQLLVMLSQVSPNAITQQKQNKYKKFP